MIAKNSCKRGHEINASNSHVSGKTGSRQCRVCDRLRVAAIRAAWSPAERAAVSAAAKAKRAARTPEQVAAEKAQRAAWYQRRTSAGDVDETKSCVYWGGYKGIITNRRIRTMAITECKRGHKTGTKNSFICPITGSRKCRVCDKLRKAAERAAWSPAQRAAVSAAAKAKRAARTPEQVAATAAYMKAWYARRKALVEAGVQS